MIAECRMHAVDCGSKELKYSFSSPLTGEDEGGGE